MHAFFPNASAHRTDRTSRGLSGFSVVEPVESRLLLSAGDPDPTFGPGGIGRVATDFAAADERAGVVVPLAGGTFVVVGRTAPGEADVAVARYNADGSLDMAFGRGGPEGDGRVVTNVGRGDVVAGAAQGPGGTLVVALTQDAFVDSGRDTRNFVLLRYAPDGTLDPAFGRGGADGDGIASVSFGDLAEYANCAGMTVQPDGRIVLAGTLVDTGPARWQYRIALARFLPDGTLDRSFGRGGADGDGRIATDLGAGSASAGAVAAAPDGKFVVGGSLYRTSDSVSTMAARFNADGSLDIGYGGGDGVAEFGVSGPGNVEDLAVLPDGRVLASGTGFARSYVLRLTAGGVTDTTFGGDGEGIDPGIESVDATPAKLAPTPDGRLVVAGGVPLDDVRQRPAVAVFRFDANGHPNPSFGNRGRTLVPLESAAGEAWAEVSDAAAIADGRVLVAATQHVMHPDSSDAADFLALRFQADGDDGDGNDQIAEAVPLAVGAAITGQRVFPAIDVDLYRVTVSAGQRVGFDVDLPAGSALDPYLRLFDARGNVLAFNDNAPAPGEASGTEAFLSYRFPAAGAYYVGVSSRADAGYDPVGGGRDGAGIGGAYTLVITDRTVPAAGGDLDLGFGTAGKTITALPAEASASAVAPTADGGAVVAGSSGGKFAVARYRADGALDLSFAGGTGVALTNFGTGPESGAGVAVQPDGRIVVAGTANGRMAVARYNANGLLDRGFGVGGAEGDGRAVAAFPLPAEGNAVALAPGGRIVVAGRVTRRFDDGEVGTSLAVARFNADGTPDGSFGTGGTVIVGFERYECGAVAVRPDGGILVAGTSSSQVDFATHASYFNVVALAPDGSPDATFGPERGGQAWVDLDPDFTWPSSNAGRAMAVLPDGRIVVAGAAASGPGAVRFTPDGKLDHAFGGDGIVILPRGAMWEGFAAVTPAAGGKVVLAATAHPPADASVGGLASDVQLVRLNADGSVDASFEGDARPVSVDFGGTDVVAAIAARPDGRVLVAGTSDGRFALASLMGDAAAEQPTPRVYEAELAAVSGATVSATYSGFTGTGYVDYAHATGDWVEFTIDAPAAGDYTLGFRYANGGASARPMELRVAGVASPLRVDFVPTGSWRTWNSESLGYPVMLAAGTNKVRLLATGQSGPNLDALLVTPVAQSLTTYQAESARLSGSIVAAGNGGYTGTGYADYVHDSGDSVEFTIDAPTSGTYALDFRYANGSTSDRPLDLSVDGQVLTGRLSFAPTGAWRTWNSVVQSVLLAAGRHTIRLTAAGRSGPNLDALTVRPGP